MFKKLFVNCSILAGPFKQTGAGLSLCGTAQGSQSNKIYCHPHQHLNAANFDNVNDP